MGHRILSVFLALMLMLSAASALAETDVLAPGWWNASLEELQSADKQIRAQMEILEGGEEPEATPEPTEEPTEEPTAEPTQEPDDGIILGTVVYKGKTDVNQKVNLRKKPSKNGDVLLELKAGTQVELLENADGWWKVKYEDTEGYMMEEFIQAPEELPEPTPEAAALFDGSGIKVSMSFSQSEFTEPEEITVSITVSNEGDTDMISPLVLCAPSGVEVDNFDTAALKSGESRSWSGEWTVTQEQLEAGKLGYRIKYSVYTTGGEIVTKAKNFYKKITYNAE